MTSLPAAGIPAERIFFNGRVWTGERKLPWAEALAVWGGRIAAVGRNSEIAGLKGPLTETLDLQGMLVVPGFIDNHTHFMSGGFQLLGVDLRDAGNEQEFAQRLGNKAASLPEGSWITGGDWDHEAWPSRSIPRKEMVDPVTPKHPILVSRLDGHMALANSRALQIAGITRQTKDPPGGTIVRDPATGEPTGILKDAAMSLVSRHIPDAAPEQRLEAARAAVRHAREMGVTMINDMAGFDDLQAYQKLLQAGELTLRVYAITPLPQFQKLKNAGVRRAFGGDYIRVGAVKGFMDGSLGSTTAWFFEPFTDASDTAGLPSDMMFPEGNMKRLLSEADKAGLQIAVHAIGDRANATLLDYFQQVERENIPWDRRFRVEHAQHLRPQEIPKFRELKVIASMQPYHAIDDGRWAEKRIGHKRCETTYAFKSLLEAGAVLTFGSDWTVAPLNPLLGVYAAVTRRTLDGKNPQGWIPEQKISVEQAMQAYTASNAYACFTENDLGTLRAGKLADCVVLSDDIFSIPAERIKDVRVMMTVVGGKVVFRR